MVVGLLGVAFAFSIRRPWTSFPPEFVVIGTLESVERGAFAEAMKKPEGVPSYTMQVFDVGIVVPDTVLHGDPDIERIEIAWVARYRLEPPVEGCSVAGPARDFDPGDRCIWEIWPGRPESPRRHDHIRQFETDPLDSLPAVLRQLSAFRAWQAEREQDQGD